MGTLIWIIMSVLTIIPMMKLLPHFRYDKLWALACVIPLGTLILLWLMATKLQELEKR